MKRLSVMLLVLVMLLSWLPATAAAEDTAEAFSDGTEKETTIPLDSSGLLPLAEGEHIQWIHRLKNPPHYAREFYKWLEENTDGDGTEDALIDVTQGTFTNDRYLHSIFSLSVTMELSKTDYPRYDEASAAAAQMFSDKTEHLQLEAEAYAMTVVHCFIQDHPEVFWLNNETKVVASSNKRISDIERCWVITGTVEVSLLLQDTSASDPYDFRSENFRDPNAVYAAIARRDARIDQILSGIPGDATVYDKVVCFNDWLTHNNAYNSGWEDSFPAEAYECISALDGRVGSEGPVCEGYSRAFKVLCDSAGIPCVLLYGADHMWNYVKVDGAWYAVDVTWNDPTSWDETLAVSGNERHSYLLCGGLDEIAGQMFLASHPVNNGYRVLLVGADGPFRVIVNFANGPSLSANAYTPFVEDPECTHQNTEVLPGVSPNCEEPGLTEGKRCTDCGKLLLAQEVIAATGHGEFSAEVVPPACLESGYTTHTCACGYSYRDTETPATGHTWEKGECLNCGAADPTWVEVEEVAHLTRIAGSHRFDTAFLAALRMKQYLDIDKFDTVVVASGMDFADALSGSYLAAVKNAPILLACDVGWINEAVKDFIRQNMNPGGTVYILGGTKAIPDSFQTGLEDFNVQRLAGDNRFQTNLKVLEEAGIGDKPILVATGLNFADCLSASAAKQPILLVFGNKLLDDQVAFLETNKGRDLYIIGGTGAVSSQLEAMLTGYGTVERLAGNTRFDTSVLIAKKFFDNPKFAVLAYAWDFPDGLCGGSLAAALNAPLILTMPKYEKQAADYIQAEDIPGGFVLGGEKLIPATSANLIFDIR